MKVHLKKKIALFVLALSLIGGSIGMVSADSSDPQPNGRSHHGTSA